MATTYTLLQDPEIAPAVVVEPCPYNNESYQKLTRMVPEAYKPTTNTNIGGLLVAFGQGDCRVEDLTAQVKKQLYVETAELQYLNRLGASVGVRRPAGVGMKDPDYRSLIPVMSYVPKQIRQALQALLAIWYGPLAVSANVESFFPEPYPLVDGQTLTITTDELRDLTFYVKTADYLDVTNAKAQEVADAMNRQFPNGELAARVQTDPTSLVQFVNVASSVIGATGSVEITGGTAAAAFTFPTGKQTINSLSRPAVLYEVNNEELVVLLPSSPAVVTRKLKGALHFNKDSSGTIGAGYVFDRNAKYSISSLKTTIIGKISKGTVLSNILVNPLPASWPATAGYFVLDYGHTNEEGPIRYLTAPNSGNLVIDPSYVFKFDHAVSASIHYVRGLGAPKVKQDGTSYAAYVTGLATARQALEDLIVAATAVGVVVRFLVQAPAYKFSNPALDVNSAV